MAEIDPRLLFAIKPQVNIGKTFSSLLGNVANLDAVRENRQNAPLRNQMMQQRADSGAALSKQDKDKALTQFSARIKPMLDAGDFDGVRQLVEQQQSGPLGGEAAQFLQLLQNNPALAKQRVDQVVQIGTQSGALGSRQSVGSIEFNELLRIAQDPRSSELERNSARRKLGDLAKQGTTTKDERLGEDPNATENVGNSKASIESKIEDAKLTKQLAFKPQIAKAIKLAEKEATSRGDTLSELQRSEAALPGLLNAVRQLKDLAPIATSTFGGKLFDSAVKQTGFGSTEGSTARAKFIAIINNQVLPLLKETFGAAFTFQEGESLKATMGDPDATEEEKLAQLEAFIDQKVRNIKTKKIQLGEREEAPDFSGFKIISVDQ